jgi:pimeloyl-ACP methyl ester carboxylesterase
MSERDYIRPIEHYAGAEPPAPEWFKQALAAPCDEGAVSVGGASIRYTAWGPRGMRGLILVHGGRAHRNWWRPFAPYLAETHRVVALDMSGMGDSDWRETYSLDQTIDELFAVIEHSGAAEAYRPMVVGHSFGGWVTLAAVERFGERLAGAVVIDSPIGTPDPDEGYTVLRNRDASQIRDNKVYPTREEAIRRFRFLPNQDSKAHYLVDYIARQGLKEVPGGWTWKFDPSHGKNFEIHYDRDLFVAARCPLAFVYGERSAFAHGEGFEQLRSKMLGRTPFIVMPEVRHHLMMEEPIAFISALKVLFACWPVRVGI